MPARVLRVSRVPLAVALCAFLAAAGQVSTDATRRPTRLRGLIVLIDFSDQPAAMPVDRANAIVNGAGYTEPTVTSSLRDYWLAQSRGQIDLTHDVVGYFRAPQPASWYQTQSFSAFIALTRDALDWVAATQPGVDWNALSLASGPLNRNGTEEGTFLSIAFMTTAWIPGTGGTHFLTGWTAPNGVATQQIVGATFIAPWDTGVNLFWLTHEQGHMIWGWPDTYDTNAVSHGTGLYSLMSGNQGTGDIEPVGAPFLVEAGWVTTIPLERRKALQLTPDGDAVAVLYNPFDDLEYFVVEARANSTIGNGAFPASRGLVVWHVDGNVTTSNTHPEMTPAAHYRVSVEQADGRFDLERFVNPGDAGDVFGPGDAFGALTQPDSSWWDGSPSGLTIDDIRFGRNGRIAFRASLH